MTVRINRFYNIRITQSFRMIQDRDSCTTPTYLAIVFLLLLCCQLLGREKDRVVF